MTLINQCKFEEARKVAIEFDFDSSVNKISIECAALRAYYASKVFCYKIYSKDFIFTTHTLADKIEALIVKTKGKEEYLDVYVRLIRARFSIELSAARAGVYKRASDSLKGLEKDLKALSVETLKHYVAILCQNYEVHEFKSIEIDDW